MNREQLKAIWKNEELQCFSGWNFSYLNGRWEEEPLPWSYKSMINAYLKPSYKLLDMGTGGGEFLLTLGHPYKHTSVTETWPPNVKLCRERLTPLGIHVHQVDDACLPFEHNTFDIIINRHESYVTSELKRILKPHGIFITQQVGGDNNKALSWRLTNHPNNSYDSITLDNMSKDLVHHGFQILHQQEYRPYLRFYDIGALVYFAKIIDWEFPKFSVDGCFDTLYELQEELDHASYIESTEHRIVIVSKLHK